MPAPRRGAGPDGRPEGGAAAPGLYLHVPFCASICPYCDFAVMKGGRARRAAYVEALIDEIALWSDGAGGFDTVYLGGGTPSILGAGELERLADAVERHLRPAPGARWTLEANPEDVTPANLAAWRLLGIGTVSLGLQSLSDPELLFLGRQHGAADGLRAAELALAAGFDTVSIDLIYGLPGQTLADWDRTLDRVVELAPQHLSCYELTVHEKTVFGVRSRRGELVEMPDGEQAELFVATHERLGAAGYEGYEVSNFAASPEHRSAHNEKYWHHVPYLGLGPAAHSFDGARRWWNEEKESVWRRRLEAGERPVADGEELGSCELALERLMLALRTGDGLDLDDFASRYGVALESANGEVIDRLVAAGRLERRDRRLVPTVTGLAVADSLAVSFEIPESESTADG